QIRCAPDEVRPCRTASRSVGGEKKDDFGSTSHEEKASHSGEKTPYRMLSDCCRTNQKSRGKRQVANHLQTDKPENHLLPFGFPTGRDVEEVEVGSEGHYTDLSKVQYDLPIDSAGLSCRPGQEHHNGGRYPEE